MAVLTSVPRSGGGSDKNFVFTQATPATVWTIAHNLGKRCAVTVVDSAGDQCEGDVVYVDNNTIQITFAAAFSGSAYCN
jgi:hypothetical protein